MGEVKGMTEVNSVMGELRGWGGGPAGVYLGRHTSYSSPVGKGSMQVVLSSNPSPAVSMKRDHSVALSTS